MPTREELQCPAERVRQAAPQALPGLWTACLDMLGDTLRDSGREGFVDALEAHIAPVLALIERDKDLANFQVLRQDGIASTGHNRCAGTPR